MGPSDVQSKKYSHPCANPFFAGFSLLFKIYLSQQQLMMILNCLDQMDHLNLFQIIRTCKTFWNLWTL